MTEEISQTFIEKIQAINQKYSVCPHTHETVLDGKKSSGIRCFLKSVCDFQLLGERFDSFVKELTEVYIQLNGRWHGSSQIRD